MKKSTIPIIKIGDLETEKGKQNIADQIFKACRNHGFFYVSDHGIDLPLQTGLEEKSKLFFELPDSEKMKISMDKGGKAWRGFFPLHGELTSGIPDRKEGLYFGTELDENQPKVKAGIPLHGANLFPEEPVGFKETVSAYIDKVTGLGHKILKGISLSLGLDENYFDDNYTNDPLILFRIFHYPPQDQEKIKEWGVGEHTDYGLLTILRQDEVGGLQVKSGGEWIDAPPIPNTFVCNIGDMLDRITGGFYKSTPHRVLNLSGKDRYSFPLFFDPGFDTEVKRISNIGAGLQDDYAERWDNASVHDFTGTYGQYLLNKIGKVFPDLGDEVL